MKMYRISRLGSFACVPGTGRRSSNSGLFGADSKHNPATGKGWTIERFMLHPSSSTRVAWDLSAGLLLTYDVFVVPLQFFPLDKHIFLTFMDWLSGLFWTFDMGMSLITGYTVGVEVVLVSRLIWRHYMRTWLCFDICVVVAEWVVLILSSVTDAQNTTGASSIGLARGIRIARFLRIVRFLRLARLYRLRKFKRMFDEYKERANSEVVFTAMRLLKIMICAFAFLHFMACAFYSVGAMETAGQDPAHGVPTMAPPSAASGGWLGSGGGGLGWVYREKISTLPLGDRYLYSVYRLLAMLHPSSLRYDMALMTKPEMVFAMFATGSAIVLSSVFISVITNAMADMNRVRQERNSKLQCIRDYTQKHVISTQLSMHLRRYINTGYQKKVKEKEEASLMGVLPDSMVMDIKHESWSPLVVKHPFFSMVHSNHLRTEVDLCYRALGERVFNQSEVVFHPGDSCANMHFIFSGTFAYTHSSDIGGGNHFDLLPGQWVSEAVLWIAWENCGELSATNNGSCCAVCAEDFAEVMREHEYALYDVVLYARNFVYKLNDANMSLTDLGAVNERAFKHLTPEGNNWSNIH